MGIDGKDLALFNANDSPMGTKVGDTLGYDADINTFVHFQEFFQARPHFLGNPDERIMVMSFNNDRIQA
ncbi:hypothetical protein MACH07_21960 [Flagellimonas marinaquae]|uniref:Uncharacterized protein n=1 Tax=Flagellimonas marinaquae TaxID=254955 RepID=A0AA48KMP5_9FLAO|nr:hypothetical protein MACH07_21960 [Allomuricauda aquimarina]